MTPPLADRASAEASLDIAQSKHSTFRRTMPWYAVACLGCLGIFVAVGFLLIPLLGFETDEVMFVHALWLPKTGVAWFSFYHHYMPNMLMSYVGGLKSWIYAPLLAVFEPSIWVVRVPVLLLAAFTICLAGRFLWRIGGPAAAVTGMALLAFDSAFLLTSVFDWGPVVLQNLLLISFLLVGYRWYRTRAPGLLFLAGLLIGLALWNKALFLWNLSAMMVAGVLFARRQIREVWSAKRLAILLFGILLGGYPLLRYNLGTHGATIAGNARLRSADIPSKARLWRLTLDGLAARDSLIAPSVRAPDRVERPLGRAALQLANAAGLEFSTWGLPIGSCLMILGLWTGSPRQRRWISFFLVSCLLAWAEAALTVNAGTSIHHTCLFLIQWYAAIALASAAIAGARPAWVKAAVVGAVLLLCTRSLVALAVTYANLLAFDAHVAWTNADKPFVDELLRTGAKRVITADWGLSDVVTTRSLNRIAVDQQTLALSQGTFDEPRFRGCRAPECVIVGHVAARSLFPQAQSFLKAQLSREDVTGNETEFRDSHGQPVITLLRLRPVTAIAGSH